MSLNDNYNDNSSSSSMNNNNNNNNNVDEMREEDQQWVWRNGLCCSLKKRISVLNKKLNNVNKKIEKYSQYNSHIFLKDVIDLNRELTGYFAVLTDNINIRDLFDFLTICFYEYEHFFKEHEAVIMSDESVMTDLLPYARDIVYNHVRSILEFISNNTIDAFQYRQR